MVLFCLSIFCWNTCSEKSSIDLEEVLVAGFSLLCPLGDYCTLIVHLLNSYTGLVLLSPHHYRGRDPWTPQPHREAARHQSKEHSCFRFEKSVCSKCWPLVSCNQSLLKFMFPLGLVYFAEYFINQGLVGLIVSISHLLLLADRSWVWSLFFSQMELLYFPNFFLNHAEQYRWSVCLTEASPWRTNTI